MEALQQVCGEGPQLEGAGPLVLLPPALQGSAPCRTQIAAPSLHPLQMLGEAFIEVAEGWQKQQSELLGQAQERAASAEQQLEALQHTHQRLLEQLAHHEDSAPQQLPYASAAALQQEQQRRIAAEKEVQALRKQAAAALAERQQDQRMLVASNDQRRNLSAKAQTLQRELQSRQECAQQHQQARRLLAEKCRELEVVQGQLAATREQAVATAHADLQQRLTVSEAALLDAREHLGKAQVRGSVGGIARWSELSALCRPEG